MSQIPHPLEDSPTNNKTLSRNIMPVVAQDTEEKHPVKPLFSIEPSGKFVSLDLKELWAFRELLFFLIWRDVKVRYRQTVLGVAWAVIQPVFMMLIFWAFFGHLSNIPSGNVPYPLFALAGLLPWMFFANAVTNGGNSLLGSSNLITKVYFPRMVIPWATVLAGALDFLIAFTILISLLVMYRLLGYPLEIGWQILLFPCLLVLLTIFAAGMGTWMAALNVKYRDVRYALPFMVQLWMFATPIIYPSHIIPEKLRIFFAFNPMAGIIEAFRASLFSEAVDWVSLGISATIALGVSYYGVFAFKKTERRFADVI